MLKLFDGYLQSAPRAVLPIYVPPITHLYLTSAATVSKLLKSATGSSAAEPDPRLPFCCEGLSLATQCVQALLLQEEGEGALIKNTVDCMGTETIDGSNCIYLTIGGCCIVKFQIAS